MVLRRNNDGTFSIQVGPWMSTLAVGMIMFMIGQSVIALRWGSQLDQRVAAIEKIIHDHKIDSATIEKNERELQIRFARLEERLSLVYETLRRFEEQLTPRRFNGATDGRP
jgi:hypothetical protein